MCKIPRDLLEEYKMTFFSIVLLGLIFAFSFKKSRRTMTEIFINLTALATALELMISIGSFISIGRLSISYSEILIVIDVVIAIILLRRVGLGKRTVLLGGVFILSCLVSLFLAIVFPYEGVVVPDSGFWDLYYFYGVQPEKIQIGVNHVKEIIHVICYVIIFSLSMNLSDEKKDLLEIKTFKYLIPFIWFGLFEFVMSSILGQMNLMSKIEATVFGNDYMYQNGLVSLGVANRLKGLKSEPSMYAFVLFVFFLLSMNLYYKYRDRRYRNYALTGMFLMIASLSFTAVVCIAVTLILGICYFYKKGSNSKKLIIAICSIFGLVVAFRMISYIYNHDFSNYFFKRIHYALLNLNNLDINGWSGDFLSTDGSTKVRLISIVYSFKYMLKSPLFGLALGSTYAHSTLSSVAASIGIVGTILWWSFTFKCKYAMEGRVYLFTCLIWTLFLVVLDNGLFPFYGVQNIIIVQSFQALSNNFAKRVKKDEKN